jgi:predicted transcriptional regulator
MQREEWVALDMPETEADLRRLTADVVTAFLSLNQMEGPEIPNLIKSIYITFAELGKGSAPSGADGPRKPTLPDSQSIQPDYLICLECEKKFKSLKLHLQSHDLTPNAYRAKWGLSPAYPMSAPNYSASRSTRAIKTKFGHWRKGKGKTRPPTRQA